MADGDYGTLRRWMRRAAKSIWWMITPWRTRQRVRFLRQRALVQARAAERTQFLEREAARKAARARGELIAPGLPLDLYSDAHLEQVSGLPLHAFMWRPVSPQEVLDTPSAARFCIDLWRRESALRSRFPQGFAGGRDGAFGQWLLAGGAIESGLDGAAQLWLEEALGAEFSASARQVFLSSDLMRKALPQGLTPVGMRDLFRWFARGGAAEAGLEPEQVWILFIEASLDPVRELMLAYSFTPEWQQAHPDGLTIFGRDAFAHWVASEYGASGHWLDASRWPEWQAPSVQVLAGFWAREPWRSAFPDATANAIHASAMLEWLGSKESGVAPAACEWVCGLDAAAVASEIAKPGANVIGHFCYPSGLRVSVESMVEAMEAVGVSTSLRDVRTDAKDDPRHVDFRGTECHEITIIHTQPEPFFDSAYERADLYERRPRTYRVAYWYWEFDSIPDSWVTRAKDVDEVWAATEFVAKGLREKLSVPVRTLFPGVKLAPYQRRDKAYFGLKEEPFTFLFTFHMMSVMERKNPLGLIRAFGQAFGPEDSAQLVLKTSFGDRHPQQLQELRDAAAGAAITIIDQVYNPDEVLSLMDACDAYVSLHRSEGLGLTIAEAMLMGKPVIATNFSGSVDFMDESNSLPAPYELVELAKPIPPYDAGLTWAEPSIDEAARLMRKVYENQQWARELGLRAKASAESNLSLDAAGRRFAARLAEIRAFRRQLLP